MANLGFLTEGSIARHAVLQMATLEDTLRAEPCRQGGEASGPMRLLAAVLEQAIEEDDRAWLESPSGALFSFRSVALLFGRQDSRFPEEVAREMWLRRPKARRRKAA